ncbi:hypothetical protein ACJX0J_023187, partial [Zea mays]
PAISIGNVGQLAVDLLVSLTRARRVAYLNVVGQRPYESTSHGLSFIQQRSPAITVSSGKNHIVIISSLDSEKRRIIDASSIDSLCNEDGSDPEYEKLGKHWNCLASLAKGLKVSCVPSVFRSIKTIKVFFNSFGNAEMGQMGGFSMFYNVFLISKRNRAYVFYSIGFTEIFCILIFKGNAPTMEVIFIFFCLQIFPTG